MIKNQKHAANAREQLEELKEAKEGMINKKSSFQPFEYEIGINSFDTLINRVEEELHVYESINNGSMGTYKNGALKDISDIFIAARLAQKLSQKELAEKIGIKEQQIQRYEATDYESADLVRLIEVSMALNLKLEFKPVALHSNTNENNNKKLSA